MRVRDAEGAVAIVVALFLAFVGIGVLSLTTDLGSLRQSKRALVTDTDAAALAGAIALAEDWRDTNSARCNEPVGEAQAALVLAENNDTDELVVPPEARCPTPDFAGSVQVQARQPSPGFFSGQDDLSAFGTTTATFEFLLGEAQGFAVCSNILPQPGNVIASQFLIPGTDNHVAFPYKKAKETLDDLGVGSCPVASPPSGNPTAPGAWGWILGGDPCQPSLDGGVWCDASVGNNHLGQEFGSSDVGKEFRFPIYDAVEGQGGGPNGASFLIVGHADVTLEGHCLQGNPQGGFDPANCSPPYSTNFNGQPGFIVVSDVRVFYYSQPEIEMFDDVSYSICDVDLSGRFCP